MIYGNLAQILKKLTIIKLSFVSFAALLFSCNCHSTNGKEEVAPGKGTGYQFVIFDNKKPLYGWGYEIYSDGKAIIKQQTIPAIDGIVSFKTKGDAVRIAALVIEKLERGKSPVVSQKELDSLGIDIGHNHH